MLDRSCNCISVASLQPSITLGVFVQRNTRFLNCSRVEPSIRGRGRAEIPCRSPRTKATALVACVTFWEGRNVVIKRTSTARASRQLVDRVRLNRLSTTILALRAPLPPPSSSSSPPSPARRLSSAASSSRACCSSRCLTARAISSWRSCRSSVAAFSACTLAACFCAACAACREGCLWVEGRRESFLRRRKGVGVRFSYDGPRQPWNLTL